MAQARGFLPRESTPGEKSLPPKRLKADQQWRQLDSHRGWTHAGDVGARERIRPRRTSLATGSGEPDEWSQVRGRRPCQRQADVCLPSSAKRGGRQRKSCSRAARAGKQPRITEKQEPPESRATRGGETEQRAGSSRTRHRAEMQGECSRGERNARDDAECTGAGGP